MEASEMPRQKQADQKPTETGCCDITRVLQAELADTADQEISNEEIDEAPENVDGRRRQALAPRLREGGLEWLAHRARDDMGDGVGEERTAEKVGDEVKPVHARGSFRADR